MTKGYGVTVEEIDWSCPADLETYEKAYKMQRNEKDLMQWQLGQYVAAALSCMFPKGIYPKKPMFQMEKEIKKNGNRESQEEVAVFEMKQRIKALRTQGLPESPE